MILYSVTVNIDTDVENEWLDWMKSEHIPDVMATGMFVEYKFYRLLHETEDGGVNYSVQYFAESIDRIEQYQTEFATKLQEEVKKRYDGKYVVFRSLLETV
ncbi:DUF4286 family protein [Litoribacter alkaliphilus]|uniref:DUF4286 family protein n=1 Tax=Litoribacter ruber TaxID=702568 RepID=A0AAP2CIQ9_9BACT|nr:DUF4286 family protein [Litoribacter alkaliphilus]MBS9523320.1 DUF4286 family protein [Litoribacter alkaliphilus]